MSASANRVEKQIGDRELLHVDVAIRNFNRARPSGCITRVEAGADKRELAGLENDIAWGVGKPGRIYAIHHDCRDSLLAFKRLSARFVVNGQCQAGHLLLAIIGSDDATIDDRVNPLRK